MNQQQKYQILSYYQFNTIENPEKLVDDHRTFFHEKDITCRIYISKQGINGGLSAPEKDAKDYIDWMQQMPTFSRMSFKIDPYHEHVYPRKCIKLRHQLVALDYQPNLSKKGQYLEPEHWKEKLENSENKIIIDVRNTYETAVGYFEGAKLPPCDTFREFIPYVESLKRIHGTNTPVMMYCTGGIRCELFSALLHEKGFRKVYQLKDGIINYGKKVGSKHWVGKLFVFDDRMTVPLSSETTKTVGKCYHCDTQIDHYYNCANMDCNELFLCCVECIQSMKGCCSKSCQHSPRLRPYQDQKPNKPFRKKSQISIK